MSGPVFWWAVFGVVLMFCELALPGLVLFFFGLGALATAVAVWLFSPSLTAQIVVFVTASLALLFGLRRWLKSVFMGRSSDKTDEALPEGMIGEEALVCQRISPDVPGKVMLHGTTWKAEADGILEEGTRVEVVAQKSLTLRVKEKEIQQETPREEEE